MPLHAGNLCRYITLELLGPKALVVLLCLRSVSVNQNVGHTFHTQNMSYSQTYKFANYLDLKNSPYKWIRARATRPKRPNIPMRLTRSRVTKLMRPNRPMRPKRPKRPNIPMRPTRSRSQNS